MSHIVNNLIAATIDIIQNQGGFNNTISEHKISQSIRIKVACAELFHPNWAE